MLVNSISLSNSSRVVNFKSKHQQNAQAFNHNVIEPMEGVKKHNKITAPIMLTAAILSIASLPIIFTSCFSSVNPIEKPQPTPPPVDKYPVQTEMLSIAKILGVCPKTASGAITSFNYTDNSDDTTKTLTLNSSESSDSELVYDGTSLDQDWGTTKYIRYKLTQSSNDGGLIVKQFNTKDGNAPSDTSIWVSYSADSKYVQDKTSGEIKKYSINPDGSTKDLVATITPETDSSVLVTTADENIYEITGISVTTK